MRTTDPEPTLQRPLGEKVTSPPPSTPTWKPKPGAPEIEIGPNGQLRTNIPGNDKCN